MLFPALLALGGAFFFFVLRVQGADGSFPQAAHAGRREPATAAGCRRRGMKRPARC